MTDLPFTAPSLPHPASLRFGPAQRFELQPTERRLLIDGEPVALGRRAFDLLVVLAERPDHLQTKSELLDRVWPGLVVEEANLQMQISNLRKLLGNATIATVPGRGYRFTGEVVGAAPVTAAPVTAASARSVGSPVAPSSLSSAREPVPPATTASAASSTTTPAPARPPAPPAVRLIGRERDLALLAAWLQDGGCVTLVGTSGVGKTSLARAAAARRDGRTVWVDLAPVAHAGQMAGALARALELQLSGGDDEAPGQVVAALQGQALLLVLDNAEHVIDACAEWVARLLPAGVPLLVTSQTPLAVGAERVMRLEPLALPGAETAPGEGALALLIERIVAADHRFVATPAALPLLRSLCTQLDGLPLAIEMAAARVPVLGLQGVHDALSHRFAVLKRGRRDAAARHHTLHNALDWSYRLLGAEEQRLFRALGVFADGFTLDLAVALMTDDAGARWDVVDRLATLADRSLVVVGGGDAPRYRLLETLRAFALEQLAASAEEDAALRRRHAAAVLALFDDEALASPARLALCQPEMGNVRDAIAWARDHDLAVAARLTAQVVRTTTFTVWRRESGDWLLGLEAAMDGPEGQALPAAVQAAWWSQRARIGAMRRDPDARIAGRRAVALWRPLGEPIPLLRALFTWVRCIDVADAELAEACATLEAHAASIPDLAPQERLFVLGALGRAQLIRGEQEALLATRQAEAALARQLGLHDTADAAESSIVNTLGGLGRLAEAVSLGAALLARVDADGSGSNGNLPWVLGPLFGALILLGRTDEARALLPRVFAAGRRFDTPVMMPMLADLAAAEGRHGAAALLLGHARQRYESHGTVFEPAENELLLRVHAAVAAGIGAEAADRLVREGRFLGEDAAEALAAGRGP